MRTQFLFCIVLALLGAFAFAQQPDDDSIDSQLLDDLPALNDDPENRPALPGEDIGESEESPIESILYQMQESSERLRQGDTSTSTSQLQRQIADDLAKLIEQLRGRQPPPASAAQSQQSVTASPTENQNSATSEEDNQGEPSVEQAPPDVPVGRGIWGHLPGKVREQINSSAIDEFLPTFEEMIEAYYRRLAEEPEQMPRQN